MNYSQAILLVEDHFDTRLQLKKMLVNAGYKKVHEARDGAEAIKVLKFHKINLIISDWVMPQIGGIDLLKKVRSSKKYSDIPFLMVTCEADRAKILEAIQADVSNYIVKPVSEKTLIEKVNQLLKPSKKENKNE